ncbi:MAG: DUF459 domain-containing protein [Acidobacteria bacterium]|nr:DUF459 domain-containing protein [Acidobacteriota bacterium]
MASAAPPRDPRCRTSLAPWAMLALCWGLALGMGALVGRELHVEAERNFALGEGPRWQVAATAALDRIGAVTGLARLREALEARKRAFYGTSFTVGGRQSPSTVFAAPADASDEAESTAPAPADASGEAESIAATPADASDEAEPIAAAPTPAPRRVLLVGASSIQTDLGRALERRIEDELGVEVLRHGRHSTGMARPDYFDWNARALELSADFRPDLVIAQFGGNDGQGLTDRDTGRAVAPFFTDAWDAEYGARLEGFVGLFADEGVPVVILGMPAMRNAYHQSKMARINAVTRAACERAGAYFVDTFAMTADAAGNPVTRAEVDGRTRIVHAGDGMHLSVYGSDMVAAGIVDALADRFTFARPAEAVSGAAASVAEAAPPNSSRPATIEPPPSPRARPGGPATEAAPRLDVNRPTVTSVAARAEGGPATEAALGLDREAQRLIQRGLREQGFDPGSLDGIIGRRTRAAIRRWQTARGLPATGYVDELSARALSATEASIRQTQAER